MGPTSAPGAFMCVAMLKPVAWQPVLWLKFGMAVTVRSKQDAAFTASLTSLSDYLGKGAGERGRGSLRTALLVGLL